jgi:hypothetical protein
VDGLAKREENVEGIINEVGLERDDERFGTFNLRIAMIMDTENSLTYEQGEEMMNELRKRLLGKRVKIAAIIVPCTVCGKGFNTEAGMKQHMRIVHGKKKAKEGSKDPAPKKAVRKKRSSKRSSKKGSSKKT